jgi:serine/threonine protein kinase
LVGELEPETPVTIDPKRVKEIFLEAAEQPDHAARVAYLDGACGGDAGLRNRVEALLRSHDAGNTFLGAPAAAFADSALSGTLAVNFSNLDPGHDDESDTLRFLAWSNRPDSLGRLGHYEVLEVLGKGGFGIVFRAFDEKLQRIVAIKVLAPVLAATSPARKRFLREARSSAKIRHANVVQVYAVEEQPLPYLVMEFIPGETLQQRLDRKGPLETAEVVQIGRQIAEGLAAAHDTGLIHRDIKPGNILIEAGPHRHVKITDFGLARAADDASMTQSGIVAGTPNFMAPEQARGETLDHRADLFSLGSVLYTMCSGRPPFRANSTLAVLKRVSEDTPRPVPEIIPETPQWLCDLITRLHAKQPENRISTANEVADLLARGPEAPSPVGSVPPLPEAVVEQQPRENKASEAPAKTPSPRGRTLRWVAAPALLLLVVSFGMMEATGVTNVRGAVQRYFSPSPPLVIDDGNPNASDQTDTAESPATPPDAKSDANAALPTAVAMDWERAVAALPAREQVQAVIARLQELNPKFDGAHTSTLENGVVTGLRFLSDEVENIAPVRALQGLTTFDCRGTYKDKGKLSDLSPLKGMTLTSLDCSSTQIADLTPLAGMPLTFLQVNHNPVSDLAPLKGMPLLTLGIAETKVSDLSPLQGMKLQTLGAQLLPVTDLTPLEGMPLTGLDLYHTLGVTNLESLKGMPLEDLNIQDLPVTDLSPLQGMTTLRTLLLQGNAVSDLTPLRGLKLTSLLIMDKQVTDLSPLRGMPLVRLVIYSSGASDLNPLEGMPLHEVRLTPQNITQGWDVLRGIKSLRIIGAGPSEAWPPEEFWDRYDRGDFTR